ncbi:YebC/PmpR family DNA-binding transcriptional regulator [Patescibacteria group bacterium]|nr:YebC/PmpR family DNA-binding transcriptional regulator [Patescibacteria group bacterium]
MKTLTDNGNRTSSNLRTTMQKYGGTMAEIGSVARQFDQKGVIIIDGIVHKEIVKGNEVETTLPYDLEALEMDAIEA